MFMTIFQTGLDLRDYFPVKTFTVYIFSQSPGQNCKIFFINFRSRIYSNISKKFNLFGFGIMRIGDCL